MIYATQLQNTIQSFEERKFSYGDHDCAVFAFSCFEAAHGVVLNRPQWGNSKKSIKSAFQSLNAKNFHDAVLKIGEQSGLKKYDYPAPYSICMIDIKKHVLAFFDGSFMVSVSEHGLQRINEFELLFSLGVS